MKMPNIASTIGITSYSLERLLAGEITYGVSSRLGGSVSSLQDFLNGNIKGEISSSIGVPPSALQEIRNALGKEGAIGLIVGMIVQCSNSGRSSSGHSI